METIKEYSFPAAHLITEEGEDGKKNVIKGQTIKEHCESVSNIAKGFAKSFGAEDAAALCGLAHDIGKYSKEFQRRIWEDGPKVDHSTAGAIELKTLKSLSFPCVAGHHSGLPDIHQLLNDRLNRKLPSYESYKNEILLVKALDPLFVKGDDVKCPGFVRSFYIRMLFSCLVDADFLDTESFMLQGAVNRSNESDIETLCERLEGFIFNKKWLEGKGGINNYRSKILEMCISTGKKSGPGIYTLTVPTGGGKTVASLAFALNHARRNGMKRVIYVVPYCAIIDQTVDTYVKILGEESVLAHYSEAGIEDSESGYDSELAERKKLAAENWDMPVVVTTAVQFFESLFSNRVAKCRKLHNIADSVVVFDEAQTIPVDFLRPCIYAITELALHYHTTCVLCTATQPSLERFIQEYRKDIAVKEICQGIDELYSVFKRVRYENLGKIHEDDLTCCLKEYSRVLCIVSTRSRARRLYEMLPEEGRYHLSTRMTPEHRKRTLATIRERLAAGDICRVISTSLIEAGVDLDFPVVYREQAGLDSLIQAGGRCNREGKLAPLLGKVFIFRFMELNMLPASMRLPAEVTGDIIRTSEDISSPQSIKKYFEVLYYNRGEGLDRERIIEKLAGKIGPFKFAEAANKFRLIDTFENRTIFIPRSSESIILAERIRGLAGVLTKDIYRRAGKYSVSVSDRVFDSLRPALEIVNEEFAILSLMKYYSDETGIYEKFEGGESIFI